MNLQSYILLAVVLLAAVLVAWHRFGPRRRSRRLLGCDGCDGCRGR
ncbi:MAG: hypothetical protein K5928_05720 [Prevotella sp.]|nr:hypothetical protein [Prevotella sp.]